MGSEQNMTPSGRIRVPTNYPSSPTPGKLELLLEANEKDLYHRYSPYTENSGLISFGSRQPYIWAYPDEGKKGLNGLKRYESRLFPLGSAPQDVIRVTKFLASGRGVLFIGKQLLLQTGNAFPETRLYNPISPIIASGMTLTAGIVRPQRHIELGGGLLGLAKSFVKSTIGPNIPGFLGMNNDVQVPPGSLGAALPDINSKTDAKGLLRAPTSNTARSLLEKKWATSSTGTGQWSLKSALSSLAKSVFGNFLPQNQNGLKYRGDEGAYGLMIGAGGLRFVSVGRQGEQMEFSQRWVGGGKTIRKRGEYPVNARLYISAPNSKYWWIPNDQLSSIPQKADHVKVGYDIGEKGNLNTPGVRYGDNVGAHVDPDFGASDLMVNYDYYSTDSRGTDYPTKISDPKRAQYVADRMKEVIDGLKKVSGGAYTVDVPANSKAISSNQTAHDGYNQLFETTNGQDRARKVNPLNYRFGFLKDYRDADVIMVDNSITTNPVNNSYKLPTTGHFDAINTLTVLGKDRKIDNSKLKGWNTYDPYKDDLIAFFFYDLVNEKYIPFRATVKGLSESLNATWEELSLIGRSDRLYNYGGFVRSLSFSFSIHISSLLELVPTWQRINYLSSLVKPSNYTSTVGDEGQSGFAHEMNRFAVPPMVMLTLGDMYKHQPIVIQSVTITIPDDAAWETMNKESGEWRYLSRFIKAPNVLYGQLPREIEIGLGLNLLEKERSIAGGANFGHAPRTDDYMGWNKVEPDNAEPSEMHQNLVVDVSSPSLSGVKGGWSNSNDGSAMA